MERIILAVLSAVGVLTVIGVVLALVLLVRPAGIMGRVQLVRDHP